MTTLSVRLPDSLHKQVKELAQQDGVSINQFVTVAVAEKLSALLTEEYLHDRARRGSRSRYEAALAQAPDVAPEERDRIAPGLAASRPAARSRYIHEEPPAYEAGAAGDQEAD